MIINLFSLYFFMVEEYICPIDGSSMRSENLGDGHESDFGAVCGTCQFEYSRRAPGDLEDQARRYVSGVIDKYQGLKSRAQGYLQQLRDEKPGLEAKLDLLKKCAQGEFSEPLACVMKYEIKISERL